MGQTRGKKGRVAKKTPKQNPYTTKNSYSKRLFDMIFVRSRITAL